MNLIKFFNSVRFSFWKPSLIFYLLAVASFLFWLKIGPLSWRNVDDYGTFFDVIKKINSFESSNNFPLSSKIAYPIDFQSIKPLELFQAIFKTCREGWNTYPHLWGFIYLPLTIPFLKFGLDWTRFATLVVGFISAILIAYLLSNIITTIFYSFKNKLKTKNFQSNRYLIDFFAVLIVCFNPELMLHASSYMPYQLPAISTLICISFFTSLYTYQIKINNYNETFTIKTFDISFLFILLIIWLSSLLGFQTIFIYLGVFVSSFCFVLNEKQYLKNIQKIAQKKYYIFIDNKSKFFSFLGATFSIAILLGLTRFHIIKLFYMTIRNSGTGSYVNNDGFYKFDLLNSSLSTNFIHLIHAISRLASLSIYPFRYAQDVSSFVLFLFLIPSFIFLFRINKLSKIVSLIILGVLFVAISFAFKGNYAFAPSRHNIYLFPCFWIPIITYFVYLSDQFFNNYRIYAKFLLPISLSLFFTSGLFVSINAINYTNFQKERLLQMADKSNIFPATIGQHDLWSLYWTHGDKEWNSVVGKECSINNQLSSSNLAFLYGNRKPLQLNNEKQREELEDRSNGCIKKSDKLKIVDLYEFKRDIHLEMDEFVGWSGSSAYGYLISKVN